MGLSQQYLLTRDGVLIVVKDQSVKARDLPESNKDEWCSKAYLEHLERRGGGFKSEHRDHDGLLEASQNRKVDWNAPKRPEKGIKITVGDGEDAPVKEAVLEVEEEPCDFEPLF